MFVSYHKHPHNPAPLDLHRHPEADLKVDNDRYSILKGADLEAARQRGSQLFINHLRVCTKTPIGELRPIEETTTTLDFPAL